MVQLQNKRYGVSGNFPEITAGYLCCQPKINRKRKVDVEAYSDFNSCELCFANVKQYFVTNKVDNNKRVLSN
jgi:hypothetical protein